MKTSLVLLWVITYTVKIIESSYVNNLKIIKLCENPVPPYLKEKPVILKLEMLKSKDKTLINGNVTVNVSEPTKDYLWKFMGFLEKNGKMKKVIEKKGFNCKHPVAFAYLLTANVTFDRESCIIRKGLYKFENIDADVLDHSFNIIPLRMPGNFRWIINMYSTKGTVFCFEARGEIVMISNKH